MSTGLKVVLIGCLSIIVISVIALGVGGYFVKNWWAEKREKIENVIGTEDSEYGKKVTELNQKYPFTPPSDNIVKEDRLQRFLAIRKDMNVVYKHHEAEIKKIADNQGTPSDLLRGADFINDLRNTQVKALAAQNMSKDEYTYMVQMVYINWVTMMADKVLQAGEGGNSTLDQLQKSVDEIDQQLQAPNLTDEQKGQLQTTKDSLLQQIEMTKQQLAAVEESVKNVPKENIALFQKYDKEIREHGMTGLEFLGL
jgi:hypothetical protein